MRAAEKINKHMAGCLALGRAFLPAVFTTLGGVGPRSFLAYIDRVFSDAAALEILAGGRGKLARHRRQVFYAGLHATCIIIRSHEEILLKRFSAPRNNNTPVEAELQESSGTAGTDADRDAVSGSEDENSDDGRRSPTEETFGELRGGEEES